MSQLRNLIATRYLTPLREGGSLPAVVEADDGELYVMKFLGAGQGAEALIGELVSGEIARVLGLRVPEIVFLTLEPAFGQSEPNAEIRGLLRASIGLNLGLRYLPQAFGFNPVLPAPACWGAGINHRVAGRLCDERRSHVAQHQFAGLAARVVADRPRRDPLLPPQLGELGVSQPLRVPADQGSRAAALRRPAG